MRIAAFVFVLLLLAGCQSRPGTGGFYVYTDAQGNLITVKQPDQDAAPQAEEQGAPPADTAEVEDREVEPVGPTASDFSLQSEENIEDYRPSGEVDEDLAARENERFITYVDETGQLVSRPLDMGAAREAAKTAPKGYQSVAAGGYLETYRALRADCCQHFLNQARELETGKEVLIEFGPDSPVLKGEAPYRAMAFSFPDGAEGVSLMAFIRKQAYLGIELLWLDGQGVPVMLVDQPFSRRYPETWYRYGYLQGTLEKGEGQHYLVVFLPYLQGRDGTDGLKLVTEGELVLTAQ